MLSVKSFIKLVSLAALLVISANQSLFAQNSTQISGIVVDQNGDVIPAVEITILNNSGTLERKVVSDAEGFFTFPFLPADEYSLKITKDGFDPAEVQNLLLSEENSRQFKIELKINSLSEVIKVEDEAVKVDEKISNSTNFDRTAIERFPVNGRNHQSLINLVPGVVFTPVDNKNLGQFSSNGQRTNANYFSVDGVSANFGTTNYDFLGQTGSGSIPARNIQGGLDNLVSTASLQEVTINTLDFSPSGGKMPGANISFVTRSGTDNFSFSAFENFRNGVFNAKDYFDLEKPPHVFNNFGGSFGGPLFFTNNKDSKNKAFFFLAFEGKSFTLPQPTILKEVPSLDVRQNPENRVAEAIYNAFPLPNVEKEKDSQATLIPQAVSVSDNVLNTFFPKTELFRATYSDPNSSETYSLRLDQIINSKFSFFARFNYSPSFSENRNPANLSSFITGRQITRTLTFGATQAFSSNFVNDFRFNISTQKASTKHEFDGLYGGILPDRSIFIPNAFKENDTHLRFSLNGFSDSLNFIYGNFAENEMRQLNFSDNLAYSFSDHEVKLGFDFRRLSPKLRVSGYGINYDFNSADAVSFGIADRVSFYKNPRVDTRVLSVSSYIQDNWKVNRRLNLVYGVRWEINPAPSTAEKDALFTLETAPDLSRADQTRLQLAASGTPYYQTNFRNFAPRFGAAYEVFEKNGKSLVLRGGIGTFYDLGQSQFNEIASPYEHSNFLAENLILPINNFPLSFLTNEADPNRRLAVVSATPDYQSPRTYFWSTTAQLKLGKEIFSASYVGGAGRNLQRTLTLNLSEQNGISNVYFSNKFSKIIYIDNAYSSDYHAFQFQYSRSLAQGLNAFANYSWAHSIDNNSSDSNLSVPFNYAVSNDRGSSDFDVRHTLNIGFSYDVPRLKANNFVGKLMNDWTLGGMFFARTGLPFDVKTTEFDALTNSYITRRANVKSGVPLTIKTAESPTGIKLNADAFYKPLNQSAQGNLGRNAFTGPAVWQFDSSLGRKFNLTEKLKLNLRVEVYNVFNRPNFSNPYAQISYQGKDRIVPENFGIPTRTMARGYAGAEPTGGVSPIFQLGGARQIQFNAQLKF
ncbi:MAG: carboxypeptidase-like regulatory domain-containing protein [Pyrinomonadaceae bacterium]|nr:carboxypeptidase-like regulatory domain-containing protein [Pyrinomonadaceae bacterium]